MWHRLRKILPIVRGVRGSAIRVALAVTAFASLQAAQWKFIGPQPEIDVEAGNLNGGWFTALAVDPRNVDIVYAGSSGGGVWKTSDGGKDWNPVTDTQPSLSIGSLAIDPSNPDTVYAGTGFLEEPATHLYYGAGILKSTDAGATWKNLPGPFASPLDSATGGADVIALAVNPANGQVLLAAVVGGGNLATGVYRSADGGVTWTNVLNGGQATAVLFDRSNGNIAYAGVGLGTRNGVYKSIDGGSTWSLLAGGANPLPTTNLGRTLIAIAASNPSVLYVSITKNIGGITNGSLLGIYKTSDGGQNWTVLPNVPDICSSDPNDPVEGGAPQCFRRGVLQVSPVNPNILFAGAREILVRTMDGGASWDDVTDGINGVFIHPDQSALAFSSDGAILYVADDGGVKRTASTTSSTPLPWENLSTSLAAVSFSPGISIHPADATITFGGPQEGGLIRYSGSLTWTGVTCGDGAVTAMDPQNPNTIYAACEPDGGSLWKTTSGGLNRDAWMTAQSGINFSDRLDPVSWYWFPMVIDPSNFKTLYLGTYRIYQTKDAADTWTPISGDLPGGTAAISSICVASSNSGTVYAGSTNGLVFVTVNSSVGTSATWTNRSSGLPARPITQIEVSSLDSLTAFAAAAGFSGFSGDSKGHLFKTTNGGQSWTDISGNLPNFPVNDVALDPDINNAIYVGTDIGVFGTADGGVTWFPMGTGLPHVRVTAVRLHHASRTLRAATYGRGMWDLFVPISSANPRPTVSSISRSTFKVGEAGAILTISGSGFVGNSVVNFNGARLTPLLANLSTLHVPIPSSVLAASGAVTLTVTNPQPGGGDSDPLGIEIVPPKPPLSLQLICCTAQKRPGGSQMPIPLTISAVDADGTPLAGVSVGFTPVFGGGMVSHTPLQTDETGQASALFNVGPVDGLVNVITATADGFAPVSFMEGSPFASGFNSAGGNQTAPANTQLPIPLSVSVTDNVGGKPVPGVPVVWGAPSGGGLFRHR